MYLYCYLIISGVSWTGQITNVTSTNTEQGWGKKGGAQASAVIKAQVQGQAPFYLYFALFLVLLFLALQQGMQGWGWRWCCREQSPVSPVPCQDRHGQALLTALGCHHLRGFSSASLLCRTSFCMSWHVHSSALDWQREATGSRAWGLQAGTTQGLKLGIFRLVTVLAVSAPCHSNKVFKDALCPSWLFIYHHCSLAEETLEIILKN